LVVFVLQPLIASGVLVALTWAATERRRIHLHARQAGQTTVRRRPLTWRLFREALRIFPRSHRLHLALGAVGGWV
jgi:hypothetical protein